MKHTPGPWKLMAVGDSPEKLAPCDESAESILTIVTENDVPFAAVYHEANAHLLAAAPELLEACKAMSRADNPETIDTAYSLIRAAIAKAEGETT